MFNCVFVFVCMCMCKCIHYTQYWDKAIHNLIIACIKNFCSVIKIYIFYNSSIINLFLTLNGILIHLFNSNYHVPCTTIYENSKCLVADAVINVSKFMYQRNKAPDIQYDETYIQSELQREVMSLVIYRFCCFIHERCEKRIEVNVKYSLIQFI